jgi:hypothetical protein
LVGATILLVVFAFAAVVGGILVIGAVAALVGPITIVLALVGLWGFAVLMTRWALVVPVVVVEDTPPRLALGRSTELVRGSGWKVFLTLDCAAVVSFVAALSLQAVLGILLGAWLAEFVATVLTAPYLSFVVAAMYFALAEPNAPIVPDDDAATWQAAWVDKTL